MSLWLFKSVLLLGSVSTAFAGLLVPGKQKITRVPLEAGTEIPVRLLEAVDSETGYPSRTYSATVSAPIVGDDVVILASGGDCTLTLTRSQTAGRLKGQTALTLKLTSIVFNGHKYLLDSGELVEKGNSRGKTTAKNAGIGAVVGAVLGAAVGGVAGATGGAAAGVGAGTLATALSPKAKVFLPVETPLVFTLESSVLLGGESK